MLKTHLPSSTLGTHFVAVSTKMLIPNLVFRNNFCFKCKAPPLLAGLAQWMSEPDESWLMISYACCRQAGPVVSAKTWASCLQASVLQKRSVVSRAHHHPQAPSSKTRKAVGQCLSKTKGAKENFPKLHSDRYCQSSWPEAWPWKPMADYVMDCSHLFMGELPEPTPKMALAW